MGQRGQELVLGPARAFRLRAHLVLVGQQPHVVDGDGRVLRELKQHGLGTVVEGLRGAPVHVEQPLDAPAHHDRHHQGRHHALGPDDVRVVVGDPRVLGEVVAAERAARLEHEPARSPARLDDEPPLGAAVLAGAVAHDDGAALPLAQRDAGEVAPAELLGPVHHALQNGGHVLRGVERAGQLREHLRLAPLPARLDEEDRVVERDRGLQRQAFEAGDVLGSERRVRAAGDHQHAQEPVAADEGLRHRVAHAEADHRGQRVGRIGIVVHEQPAALARAGRHHPALRRERGLRLGLGPTPRPGAERLALLVEEIGEPGPVEQAARPLHDQAEEPVEIQLGAEIPLHARQRLELLAARRLEGEEPRLLERDGGLVGEILEPTDLLRAEGAPGHVADREHPGDPAADRQRHRQHRAVPGPLDERAGRGGEGEAGIGQDIGRGDRAPLAHREAGERFVLGDPGAAGERVPRTRGRDHHQAVRGGLQLPQHGQGAAEQRADRLRDVPAHALGVERLHEGLADLGERRRVATGRPFAREGRRLIALARAQLGEIAEDEDHPHRVAGAIVDGIGAARDAALVAAPPRQQDARGERGHPVLPEHARGRALDGRPRVLVEDAEDRRELAPARLGHAPAGEVLGRPVHERHAPGAVRDDDRVPDAREGDRHLLALGVRAVLGAAPARGERADGPRHHHEEEDADEIIAVRRHHDRGVPGDGGAGGQETRAEAAVPGADDHGGQQQEELRALGQRGRQVGAREGQGDRQQGDAVRLPRLHRAKDQHVE